MLDFPASPTNGQTYTGPNNVVWSWDGIKWVNGTQVATGYAPLLSPGFSGNPTSVTPAPGDADTSIATTAFVAPAFNAVGRNLLHNSMFNVAQRGAGPWTGNGVYTLDRWQLAFTLDTSSVTQVGLGDVGRAAIGEEDAQYCLANTVTGNAGATAFTQMMHKVENVRRLAGKTVTVSFWAQSPTSLKLGVNMTQTFGTGGSPSASVSVLATGASFSLLTTWARYSTTIAVPSVSGKTVGTDPNSSYTNVQFFYSAGSSSNATAGNTGQQSGTINIFGVQLEIGTVATPLEKPDPMLQLQQCQRFYQQGQTTWAWSAAGAGHVASSPWALPVTMRATPIVTSNFTTTTNISGQSFNADTAGYVRLAGSSVAAGGVILAGTFTASADL